MPLDTPGRIFIDLFEGFACLRLETPGWTVTLDLKPRAARGQGHGGTRR